MDEDDGEEPAFRLVKRGDYFVARQRNRLRTRYAPLDLNKAQHTRDWVDRFDVIAPFLLTEMSCGSKPRRRSASITAFIASYLNWRCFDGRRQSGGQGARPPPQPQTQ